MPEAVTEEDKDALKEENWPQGQRTKLRKQKRMRVKVKGGCSLLLRHLECPWAETPDLWAVRGDKSVRKGTLCTGRIMSLEPEVKNCVNILWGTIVFSKLREDLAHFFHASQSPTDAWILTQAKTRKQISHKGSIPGWLARYSFDPPTPSYQEKEHSVPLILLLQFHPLEGAC